MPITSRLLSRAPNRAVVTPAWATINDWLESLAARPLATPLVDFGGDTRYRVGVNTLNWYLMDLLGLRAAWLCEGWNARDELWLLINPLRYRLLGEQPKRPYAYDVRDYLRAHQPAILNHPIEEHSFFALAPVVRQDEMDDLQAEELAVTAPWGRIAVVDNQNYVVGMVWSMGRHTGRLPPIFNFGLRKDI